jgi:GAF domain-containing protein
VATFLDVDRGSVWQCAPESGAVLSVTHFWQKEGAPPLPARRSLEMFPHFRERADAGEMFCFTSPKELPPAASAERAAFEEAGVRSFVAIPLISGDRALGFLVFLTLHAERPWPIHIVQQLRTLAEPFVTALIRMQSAAAIESSVAMAGAVLAALPGETAVIDAAGTIVQTNEAWATAARSGPAAQSALKVGANYLEACRNAVDMPPDVARQVHVAIESILRGIGRPGAERTAGSRFEFGVWPASAAARP